MNRKVWEGSKQKLGHVLQTECRSGTWMPFAPMIFLTLNCVMKILCNVVNLIFVSSSICFAFPNFLVIDVCFMSERSSHGFAMQFFKDRHYLDKEWGHYIGPMVGRPPLSVHLLQLLLLTFNYNGYNLCELIGISGSWDLHSTHVLEGPTGRLNKVENPCSSLHLSSMYVKFCQTSNFAQCFWLQALHGEPSPTKRVILEVSHLDEQTH